jgi:phosphopantetheinyl transferase
MPAEIVHSPNENAPFTLALWTMNESDEALHEQWEQCGSSEEKPVIKSARRNREWLASRLLMQHLQLPKLTYLPNGKPVLPAGHLSISHCDNLVALVLAETPVGIDVQQPTEQIRTILAKFCSPAEQARLMNASQTDPTSALRDMTILWSAKEAIFKLWGENVAFAEHIEIAPFACDDARITAHYKGVHGQRTFELWHYRHQAHEIVIAL